MVAANERKILVIFITSTSVKFRVCYYANRDLLGKLMTDQIYRLRWTGLPIALLLIFALIAHLFPNPAKAASISDTISTIDSGPFKDAACQTAIDSLIGTVDGLGIAAISNLKSGDASISADLTLPIGGTWTMHLFGADCSKNVFAYLKPGSDLKLSDMVSSAGTLKELDKLGLKDQAFILSNTEDSLSAEDAPDSVAASLKAASDGNDSFEITVKPGLTVLGVMDLSQSTYSKNALSFLGLKDAESQKIAVNALLGADMLASVLKGSKSEADFTIIGTMPNLTLTLPGNHKLPTANIQFSAVVNHDAKEFELKVEAEDAWTDALGISGLSLANVTIDLKAGDETAAELYAQTTIGGQELDVSWVVEKADEHTETEISLKAPEGKTFKIGSIHGLSKVPGISSLGFKELDISPSGFGGRLIWKGKELDAAVVKMGSGNKPILLMKTETFHLKDISSAVGKTPLGGITIPGMILTLAEGDPGSISTDDMPEVASAVLGELEEKSGSHLTIHEGVGMLGAIDAKALGSAGDALGASGELILGGTLGGIFGGPPEIDLYAAFPTFSPKKMPKFLRAAKDITPQLTLAFKEANGVEADIGVDLVTHLKVDKQELELETAITAVVATSGIGLNISASLDKWEDAFTLKEFDIDDLAISVEVDADSSVSAGFQGTVTLKDGKTKFEVIALVSPDLAAVGLPKEVVFELKANHIGLDGLMDLADVFIGSMGDNAVAKAARGKGLYKTLQFDKLPKIEFVQYKNDDGELEDVQILLATPGATDPALDIDGWGVGVEGRMRIAGKDIAQAKVDLGEDGFELKGEVLIHKLGPLKIKNAVIDAGAGLSDLPHLHLNADATLLGIEEEITIEFSKDKMAFEEISKFGQAFSSKISAEATIADVHNPDFDIALEFQGDLLDVVLGGIEKELNKLIAAYDGDVKKAEAAFKKAEGTLDKEEKKVDDAINKAEADAKKATDKIESAIKKVNGIQSTINSKEDKVHDKAHDLHKLHWYQVGKAISLAAQIAGLEVEIGGLYAAKGTANAALEVAKAATELTPILFQAAVLAANATFEAAKGAIEVADVAVKASEYILEGLKKLIDAYRDNFHFTEVKFDGSLQALLGNKPIVMDVIFKIFGENVNLDLSFTPTKPENIAKAIGGMVSKLAGEAADGIKHAFFGGGSSNKSSSGTSSHTQAVANWAAKNHATKDTGGFQGASWSGHGPKSNVIPMKGSLYKNASLNRCLIYTKGKLNFSSCDSTKDDHLFRFSPKGDFVAIGSGSKTPYCLASQGAIKGSSIFAAKCSGKPEQKWRLSGNQLALASGECAAVDKHKKLVLADCSSSDKTQQWGATPIADLQKLSETPASTLYSISLRDTKTGKCVDVADKTGLAYTCDDSDFQVFNLNSKSQLRVLQSCIRTNGAKKGAGIYLGKCDGKEQKWAWTGFHMQVKGKNLCLARGKTLPAPFNIQLLQLDSCKSTAAVWELEPTNIDAEGRILPAYDMIQSKSYKRCVEVRTKLQVDGLPIPSIVMWNCNGDFNQNFSFRWNGEIRALGKCLASNGSNVSLQDCYRRPSAFQITPNMLKNAGKSRNDINHQRWKMRKDGLIQKVATKVCLSGDPRGMQKMKSLQIKAGKFIPLPPKPGKVGGLGTLLSVAKCKKGDKLQTWIVTDKLPDGSKAPPYKRLAHKISGKERCLETSGDSTVRRLVARTCSTSQYQQFALTNYGEIRQMGRCVSANAAKKAFNDGVQLELEECQNAASQKFTTESNGLLIQAGSTNSLRCVVEGPVFDPAAALAHLPAAVKAQMAKLPTFAPVASGACQILFKNGKSKKCMYHRADGTLGSSKCSTIAPDKAGQVMAISGSKLVSVQVSKGKTTSRQVWINTPMGSKLPTIAPVSPGMDPATMQKTLATYSQSGFAYQAKSGQFKYVNTKKTTSTCLATAKSGKSATAKKLKPLEQAYIKASMEYGQLSVIAKVQKALKSKADKAKKTMISALKKLETAQAAGALTTARCSSSSSQKWSAEPVPQTSWKVK